MAVAERLIGMGKVPFEVTGYRLDRAKLLTRVGKMSEAESIYRDVMADLPDAPAPVIEWARFLREQGRIKEAEEAYEAVIALTSDRTGSADKKLAYFELLRKRARQELAKMRRQQARK